MDMAMYNKIIEYNFVLLSCKKLFIKGIATKELNKKEPRYGSIMCGNFGFE